MPASSPKSIVMPASSPKSIVMPASSPKSKESVMIAENAASKKILFPVMEETVWIAQNVEMKDLQIKKSAPRIFTTQGKIHYHPLCDDFGPMNLASIAQFIVMLDDELHRSGTNVLVYWVDKGRRSLTNAVFLLGAYMIFKQNASWKELADCFSWVDSTVAESFRDATYTVPDFGLTLMDCWMGLKRGIENRWTSLPSASNPNQWGRVNIAEYEHYDHPNNGYLHEVIPNRLVAFTGPVDLGSQEHRDDENGCRDLSPTYYIRVFKELGVKTVIRLNEPQYDSRVFLENGIRHFDLYFDDCTSPPLPVVDAFLKIVDTCKDGLVAVHCKAGLGRTGTLIALSMMRSHGFRAKEAIGWLRIMRPGSVIGEQQHYLVSAEEGLRCGDGLPRPPAAAAAAAAARKRVSFCDGRDSCAALGQQVAEGMRRKAIAKVNAMK